MDRTKELLKHITKEQRGIEIGPYHNPVVPRRLGFNSITLDVFDTAELRRRAEIDPQISKDHLPFIEDVDLKGSAGDIADLVKAHYQDARFDYVVSSHNFEHLPDPIRFLQGCERVLKPDGVLSMAIPDHRYCFDFYRPVTELSEWLDAFHQRLMKPTPGQVFRQGALHSLLNGQIAWSSESTGLPMPAEVLDAAYTDWRVQTEGDGEGTYRDAHCSVFTPSSLELMITDLNYLGILMMEIIEIIGPNGCEFFIHLRNPSGDLSRPDRNMFYRRRAEIMRRAVGETAEVTTERTTLSERHSKGAISMSSADLSIVAIIPLYNGARWIEQSIRSVLAQTLMPDEFIVVDDGSTDDGAGTAIVERLRQNYPLITLLRKPNGGQSSARNFAAANSTSALIALLDQDDIWYPHHLEQLIKPFRDKLGIPLGWAYSNLDIIDESGGCVLHAYLDTIAVNQPKRSLAICLSQDMHVLPSASLIAREAFEAVGGFDERLSGYEDDDLFLRIFRAGYDNVYLNQRLSKWRVFSTSTSYTERMAVSRMVYARKLLDMLPDDPRRGIYWGRDYIIPRFMDTLKGEYQRCRKSGDLKQAARFFAEMEEIGSHLPEKTRVKLYINMLGIPIRATGKVPRKWAIHTFARFKNSELYDARVSLPVSPLGHFRPGRGQQ